MSTTTSTDQDALRVANRYAGMVEKAATLQARAQACLDAAAQYRSDARANQESAENHQASARTIRDPNVAHQHALAARDAEAEAAREVLAARYYEAQAEQYGQVADTGVLTGDTSVPAPTVRTATMLPAAPDPLRVAARFVLPPGEQFAGSAATKSNDDGYMVLAAAVDTGQGRMVHVGVPVLDEEKRYWKGAHAPGKDSEVDDEEGIAYSVDTNSDRTVILDAADGTHLPEQVEQVIAQASAVDKRYRQLVKESDRLYNERLRLETKRFADGADAEKQMRLDASEDSHRKYQRSRRDYVAAGVERLGPHDRARYDALQARIDEAGKDLFEPGREQQAAEVCGLSVDEYRELVELQKKPYTSRTHAESQRVGELHLNRGLPPLLAEQAAIVYGISVDEYRELEALDEIGRPHTVFGGRPAGRTPQQQARYEQLRTAPGGVTGATAKQTAKLRDQWGTYQNAHHSDKLTWTAERQQRATLQTRARPLAEADATRLQQVITAHDELDVRLQAMGGETSARVEIPGSNGMTLVVEAVQREEEGGVDYELAGRPATTADDEPPPTDSYRTTPAGLRKVAKMLAALGGGAPGEDA